MSTADAGAIVPPTADQDPVLPQLEVVLRGHTVALHLQTFGDPSSPAVGVLPGGPGADFRLLEPLAALSDRYFVIMWDQHGAGLSQRVGEDLIGVDSYDEEIALVKEHFASGRRMTLIGHSFGGMLAARFAARHPDDVERLVLVEPGPLDHEAHEALSGKYTGYFDPVAQDVLWGNELLSSRNHEQADYRIAAEARLSSSDFQCKGDDPEAYPVWRFGAFMYQKLLEVDITWTTGIAQFTRPMLLLAGTCGRLAAQHQDPHNTRLLPGVELQAIEGAGHITLFTTYAAETVAAIRSFLEAP